MKLIGNVSVHGAGSAALVALLLSISLMVLFHPAESTVPVCTVDDYSVRFTDCSGGSREMQYFNNTMCEGGVPTPASVSVDCNCTQFDYTAQYSQCVNGQQSIFYERNSNCVDGVAAPDNVTDASCGCPLGTYTTCNHITKTRSFVYFYSPTGTCDGQAALPPSIHNIPCEIHCEGGKYLQPGTSSCQTCDAGTFSVGGGARFEYWDTNGNWSDGFSVSCSGTTGGTQKSCSTWSREGSYLSSGDLSGWTNVNSVLQYNVELVREGSITFVYQVDAEKTFDGLKFYVDDTLILFEWVKLDWTTVTQSLSAGVHIIKWVYYKDFSQDRGSDRALIDEIQVIGTEFNDESCTDCPPGFYSAAGSSECQPCVVNKYSAAGASVCIDCNATQYTESPGSDSCINRPLCDATHWTADYTACNNNQRSRVFQWLDPHVCINGDALPAQQDNLPCPTCEAGEYRSPTTWNCEFCPSGYTSPAGSTKLADCYQCQQGSAGVKGRIFHNFDTFPGSFSTGCSGDHCATSGFRVDDGVLSTGSGHGTNTNLFLEFTLVLMDNPTVYVEFNWTASSQSYSNYIEVLANQTTLSPPYYSDLRLRGSGGFAGYLSTTRITAGTYVISIRVNLLNRDVDASVSLKQFKVIGLVENGAALSCETCGNGTYAAQGSDVCSDCLPGSYSTGNLGACNLCEENQYADDVAATSCKQCRQGSYSARGSTECSSNCSFSYNDHVYDLSPLAGATRPYGPIFDNSSQVYYLNVCHRPSVNFSCFDSNDRPIASYACQQTTNGYAVDIGSQIAFYPLNTDNTSASADSLGVTLQYYDGTYCSSVTQNRQVNINMICDMSVETGYPEPPSTGGIEPGVCEYFFQWRTKYACPVCGAADYTAVDGECTNGVQRRTFVWNENRICHSGTLPNPIESSCSTVSVGTRTAIAVVVTIIVVFVILIVVAIVMWRRNRKLYSEYELLRGRNEEFDVMHDDDPFTTSQDLPDSRRPTGTAGSTADSFQLNDSDEEDGAVAHSQA